MLTVYNVTWSLIAIPTPTNDYPLALPLIPRVKSIYGSFCAILRSSLIYFFTRRLPVSRSWFTLHVLPGSRALSQTWHLNPLSTITLHPILRPKSIEWKAINFICTRFGCIGLAPCRVDQPAEQAHLHVRANRPTRCIADLVTSLEVLKP